MNAVPSRLLILSASVGAGHLRAAQALEVAARELLPTTTVKNVDVMDLTNPPFRRFYAKSYLDLVNRAPHVLGYFYDLLDQPSKSGKKRGDRLRLAVEKMNLRKFIHFLKEETWDLVLSTHFLAPEIIANLRADGKLNVPQMTVCTDFETHRLWVNQPCEHYFTATQEGAEYLYHWGVPRGDATVTGIPVHPVFSRSKDRRVLLPQYGLSEDRPVVLQMAGGFGAGPVEKLYRALLDVEKPLQLVVVAGRNEEVKKQLDQIKPPQRHRVTILGFTEKIDELMAVADLIVTKPGGLTTSETLARGLIMVIANPIPGQETRNSDFLLENGAAIKVNNVATLPYKLNALLNDPQRLKRLKDNARALGKPRAAYDILEKAFAVWGKQQKQKVATSKG